MKRRWKFPNRNRIYFFIVLVFAVIGLVACEEPEDCIMVGITVEAGAPIKPTDFVINLQAHRKVKVSFTGSFRNKYVTDDIAIINSPGKYTAELDVKGKEVVSVITVTDTVAPKASPVDCVLWDGATVSAEECVRDIEDKSNVTCTFLEEIDFTTTGKKQAVVVLVDEGDNKTEIPVSIDVRKFDEEFANGLVIEAGTPIPTADELFGKNNNPQYVTNIESINTSLAEEYYLDAMVNGKEVSIKLIITDTVAPEATITPQEMYKGGTVPEARLFVSSVVDAGPVSVAYEKEPENTIVDGDTLPVRIVLTDQCGNQTTYDSYFTFAVDEEAPVFTEAPAELEIEQGGSLVWKTLVAATDNSGYVDITLDAPTLNRLIPGEYPAFFVAKDLAGNETRKEVTIKVEEILVTVEMMDEVCNKILKKIIKEGMTTSEQLAAVCTYITNHVKYVGESPHDNTRREAYLSFTSRGSGDCFSFYATGYELLTRLGYDVLMVRRRIDLAEKGRGNHFWCLVNCGTADEPAWYHFDACVHGNYPVDSHMLTDRQVWAYTNYRNDMQPYARHFYTFDASLYPKSSDVEVYDMGIDAKYYEKYFPPAGYESAE